MFGVCVSSGSETSEWRPRRRVPRGCINPQMGLLQDLLCEPLDAYKGLSVYPVGKLGSEEFQERKERKKKNPTLSVGDLVRTHRLHSQSPDCESRHGAYHRGTLRTPLSAPFLQTLPDLVTPLKGHTLSPRSCPATRSAPSDRFRY